MMTQDTQAAPVRYVTFGDDGALTGCYLQVPLAEHAGHMIVVDESLVSTWAAYRANAARTGVEPAPPAPPAPPSVPQSLSPRQFRQALTHFGFRAQVEAAVAASGDQDLKDWYEHTSEFQRRHPEVLAMATALGFTDAQLDQLWIYGAAL